jgi:hypothetical protein
MRAARHICSEILPSVTSSDASQMRRLNLTSSTARTQARDAHLRTRSGHRSPTACHLRCADNGHGCVHRGDHEGSSWYPCSSAYDLSGFEARTRNTLAVTCAAEVQAADLVRKSNERADLALWDRSYFGGTTARVYADWALCISGVRTCSEEECLAGQSSFALRRTSSFADEGTRYELLAIRSSPNADGLPSQTLRESHLRPSNSDVDLRTAAAPRNQPASAIDRNDARILKGTFDGACAR